MEKSKSAQKGAGKVHSGSEHARSGTHLQRSEDEQIQQPKVGEQLKQKQQQGRAGKK